MEIYDEDGLLKLSPSQISLLLDKCAYKWFLKYIKNYIELPLIDTVFPGSTVHYIQEIAHVKKHVLNQCFDPESEEFKELCRKTFYFKISKGYRIKRAMEAKYRERVEDEFPEIEKEKDIHEKLCELLEKDLCDFTLKCCNVYIKEIFPLQKPLVDEKGLKKERKLTLQLLKKTVMLRGYYDLMEVDNMISDTKVMASQTLPAKDPVKERNWMNRQEQYMYYSMWYWRKYGIIPTIRQYTIKKNKSPVVVKLPDTKYTENHFKLIMEKIRTAKNLIESLMPSECFPGNNQSNTCSEDYCGFWMNCKYIVRPF